MNWTPESVREWAERNLPREFRSCHVGDAAERTRGNWSDGQAIMFNLRKFGLIAIVDGVKVPHARRARNGRQCQARRDNGHAYRLIPRADRDLIYAERLRELCDS